MAPLFAWFVVAILRYSLKRYLLNSACVLGLIYIQDLTNLPADFAVQEWRLLCRISFLGEKTALHALNFDGLWNWFECIFVHSDVRFGV